jgi:hypothetical protein
MKFAIIKLQILTLWLSSCTFAFSFVATRSKFGSIRPNHGRVKNVSMRRKALSTLTMRDHSASYWFSPGDRVEVMEDVTKAGVNLKGRTGIVVEAWEKCDIDPTCCCAEQVETDLAIRVNFQGTEANANEQGAFEFRFNEDELKKAELPVAFDGMSCKAFKLEQLEAQRNMAASRNAALNRIL